MPWGIGSSSSTPTAATPTTASPVPEQQAHSKNASIGVKVVYTPPTDIQPVVDIVAVHGLKGDAFRTWTAPATETRKEVFWLRDLLPQEVPNARILTYGYDSDPGKVFESASTNMVHHHATTLVSELHYFRRKPNERYRPIIFVCHSLGGIVVKRALIYSSTCNISHNPELRSIKVSTYGIVFLGTPHMGADLARWGKMAEMLVRMVTSKSWVDSNDALIQALGRNSETLQNITDSFLGLSTQFRMFFFWEELKTYIPGMTRDVIVEYASAVPEALPNAGRAGIHATHSDMCKFVDENSPGWNILAGVLCDYVENAPPAIEQNWSQLLQQENLDINFKIRGAIHNRRTPSPAMRGLDAPSRFGLLEGQQQQQLIGGSPDDAQKLLTAPVPFVKPQTLQENRFFVGREKELAKIHETLLDPSKRIILISSITGSGKTHLARQYFFTQRESFPGGVFWIDCQNPETGLFNAHAVQYGYASIAEYLQFASAGDEYPIDQKVDDVIAWFGANKKWLLVLDGVNIDSDSQYGTVAKYLPSTASGSIIITSINATLAGSARLGSPHNLPLDPPSLDHAVKMLAHYSQISNDTSNSAAYTELCRALTCLPLAIHAAGSYIKDTQLPTVAAYLRKHQRHLLIYKDPHLLPFHFVFDRIDVKYPQASGLLSVLSFWGQGEGGGVPAEMIWWGVRALDRHNRRFLVARDAFGRAVDVDMSIAQCLRFSVIEREPETGTDGVVGVDTLRLHPIVKEICFVRMKDRKALQQWCTLATTVFCNSFEYLSARRRPPSASEEGTMVPGVEFLTSDFARYLTHGTHIQDCIRRYKLEHCEQLTLTLLRIQTLAHPETEIKKDRISMFVRTGSGSSTTDTPSEATDSDEWHRLPMLESPVAAERPNIDIYEQMEHQRSEFAEAERQRINQENRIKELAQRQLEFEFRYPPPSRSRRMRSLDRSDRKGRARSYTADFFQPPPGPGRGRASTGSAAEPLSNSNPSTPRQGRSRKRSPTPAPYNPEIFQQAPHHNPYSGRASGPYTGLYHHHDDQQHSSSAPAQIGRIPGLPSPAYTPAYPFIPGFAPRFAIAELNPSNGEMQDPRFFTPGAWPVGDASYSPEFPSAYTHRPPSATPSEAWSEPITRSRSASPYNIFPMENMTPRVSHTRIPSIASPYPPPPDQTLLQGLGIEIGSPGYLQPGRRPGDRSRSGSRLRRSSVPAYSPDEDGAEMSRSRSEPGGSDVAKTVVSTAADH
ncbi:hypothetical protein BZA77DRAFT_322065 [Pyronema omphalodes]|nr:hypothetical protein BZA77DRAFT_322065 [Pyronema omphalodes]